MYLKHNLLKTKTNFIKTSYLMKNNNNMKQKNNTF